MAHITLNKVDVSDKQLRQKFRVEISSIKPWANQEEEEEEEEEEDEEDEDEDEEEKKEEEEEDEEEEREEEMICCVLCVAFYIGSQKRTKGNNRYNRSNQSIAVGTIIFFFNLT